MAQLSNPELVDNLKPFFVTRREWNYRATTSEDGEITDVQAGAGLGGGGSSGSVTLYVNPGDGIAIDTDNVVVDLATTSGLTFSTGELLLDGASLAGDGLVWDAGNFEFDVNVGDGLDIVTDAVAVDVTDFIDTAYGLTESTNDIRINLASPSGLSFNSGALEIADSIAGSGLSIASKVLSVDGTSLAGDGLTWDAGNSEIDLGTPGTLTVSTSNAVTASSHTHAITSSSDPGQAASLLATAGSGLLTLYGLSVEQGGFGVFFDGSNYLSIQVDATDSVIGTVGTNLVLAPSTGNIDLEPTTGNTVVTSGDLGVGATPLTKLHARDTTAPQLRVDYDASNYATLSVSSGGDLTITASGVNGTGTFDPVGAATIQGSDLYLQPDTGDITMDPASNNILPATNYDLNIGSFSKKYLTVHAAELWVQTLVAQDVLATIGGRVLVGPTTELAADLSNSATTMTVKHNNLAGGDIVVLESSQSGTPQVEFILVTGNQTANGSYWDYDINRDLDGSGANTWYAGDAVFNTGGEGEGFIDLYSDSGVFPGSTYGPTIVGNVRFVSGTEFFSDNSFEGAGAEELSNPGFETAGGGGADVFANWTETASDGAIASEGTLVNSGSAACKLTAGASVDTNVSQTISVSEADSYHLSFYTRGDGTYDGRYRVYNVTGGTDIISLTSTGVTGTTYTLVEVFFSIPDQCSSMRIDFYCPSTNAGIAYFDDASAIERVPAWVLVTAGGNVYAQPTVVRTGSWAIKIENNGTATAGVNRNISSVSGGEIWVVRGWWQGDGTYAPIAKLRDNTHGFATIAQTTGPTAASWTPFSMAAVAPAGTTTMSISITTQNGSGQIAYVDDVYAHKFVYTDISEHWAIGNLGGVYGQTQDTYGVGLGRYETGYNHITITDSGGIEFWDGDESTGDLLASWSGSTITLGSSTDPRVIISSSGVVLNDGTNDVIQLASAGSATFGRVATNYGNAYWNSSNQKLEFRGGTNGTDVQAYIDTDGTISAGGGNIKLGATGMKLEVEDTASFPATNSRRIEFLDTGTSTVIGAIEGLHYTTGGDSYQINIGLYETVAGHGDPQIMVRSEDFGSNWRGIYLNPGSGGQVSIVGDIYTNGSNVFASSSGARFEGGLYIGSTSVAPTAGWVQILGDLSLSSQVYIGSVTGVPAAGTGLQVTTDVEIGGDIIYDGDLIAGRTADHTGYIYVPLDDYIALESTNATTSGTDTAITVPSSLPIESKAYAIRVFASGASAGDYVAYGPGNTANTNRYHVVGYSLGGTSAQYNGSNGILKNNASTTRRVYRHRQVSSGTLNWTAQIIGYFI